MTAGAIVGAADAIILPMSLRTRGTPLLPAYACAAAVWTSVTLLSVIGVLFSASRLHRAGITLMLFCGPGLVMLSRAAEPIKDATGLSFAAMLVAWALLLIALAIPLGVYGSREHGGFAGGGAERRSTQSSFSTRRTTCPSPT